MTFLGADTTSACEDTWVGAIRLGMTVDLVNGIMSVIARKRRTHTLAGHS